MAAERAAFGIESELADYFTVARIGPVISEPASASESPRLPVPGSGTVTVTVTVRGAGPPGRWAVRTPGPTPSQARPRPPATLHGVAVPTERRLDCQPESLTECQAA